VLLAHIRDELVFKKASRYRQEFEYRFIHIAEPVGGLELRTRLTDSALPFEKLGLNLTRVFSTDLSKATSALPNHRTRIKSPGCFR
jgi:hypothetical protein